jgi:hypothetical protein
MRKAFLLLTVVSFSLARQFPNAAAEVPLFAIGYLMSRLRKPEA